MSAGGCRTRIASNPLAAVGGMEDPVLHGQDGNPAAGRHYPVKGDSKGALRELKGSWGGALRGTSSQFLSASEFLVFSLSLKSKVILSFRFGFSMSNLYIETPGEDF